MRLRPWSPELQRLDERAFLMHAPGKDGRVYETELFRKLTLGQMAAGSG